MKTIQIQARNKQEQNQAKIQPLLIRKADRLAVKSQQGIKIIRFRDILYCEAMSNYSRIHRRDNTPVVVSKTLKRIIELLPKNDFIRTHQSFIVSIDDIVSIHHSVHLTNGKEIPLARSCKSKVLKELGQNMIMV